MPDPDLLARLARFERQFFPRYEETYRRLVADGQHPKTLFIGCCDSRVVPYALMDCGPGELFIARNVGNLVPPWDMSAGFHGTAAAIEFAVLQLQVQNEQRSAVLQLERLMTYPMVARRVTAGALFLHAWYYVIEEGRVLVFDACTGRFDAASVPAHAPSLAEPDALHWRHIDTP